MKRVLIVAYYFPPLGMGGVQRAAKWAKFLPRFGWEPLILTVRPIRYHAFDPSLLKEVSSLSVFRTESLDPARLAARILPAHEKKVSSAAASSGVLARILRQWPLPDSKIGWFPFATKTAQRLIKQFRPNAILTTSPPLTAHLVGLKLKKKLDLPWVADFRDYWLGGEYVPTPTPLHRYFHRRWAGRVVRRADAVLAVSEPILDSLKSLDPATPGKFRYLPNGFDPEDFESLVPRKFEKKTLLYSGSLGGANDPQFFFEGLKRLVKTEPEVLKNWQVVILGQPLQSGLVPAEIEKWIRFEPYTSHGESLSALLGATGLLFVLSPRVNPGMMTGKILEYVASGRPIFAVLPDFSAAADVLREYGFGKIVTEFRPEAVAKALKAFLQKEWDVPAKENWENLRQLFSRENQTKQLSEILKEVTAL